MNLYFHGGRCCGIKTIAGFHYNPDSYVESLEAIAHKDPDKWGYNVSSDKPFFSELAPNELAVDRLDRLIRFCRRKRPQGAIEVALAEGSYLKQETRWGEELRKRGFVKTVPPYLNSNSGNMIHIYHLVYDKSTATKTAGVSADSPFRLPNDRS